MKIIADENIVQAKEAFSKFGEVILADGRKISNEILKDADALITRSITKVDKNLLQNTSVKFVGTATIGMDHFDEEYLKIKNIYSANAPGCNSFSVAEYVFSVLFYLANKNNFELKDKSIGIIGVGNIGSKVEKFARSLGMKVLLCDPPRERNENLSAFTSLEEILKCDIITLHTPLTRRGEDKTFHLIGEKELSQIKPDAILINSSRGEVVDNSALFNTLLKKDIKTILDVWENEPNISLELLHLAEIATPHIAGYSLDGKLTATKMIFEELNKFTNQKLFWEFKDKSATTIEINSQNKTAEQLLNEIFRNVYRVTKDHIIFRNEILGNLNTGIIFDQLRKQYPRRREIDFYNFKIKNLSKKTKDILNTFRVKIIEEI